ncbi:MAG TPA: bifunctional 4-hydroxy-2-oxoglutarate aldolase/2-dehydro-3-deoxy-phosphogluconate aldolase [Candidatus Bathyarchaeia archaeon]|nr:bifunctional 4-hydroxy-2-oxoglutarate aldolase/2-dehydro-3-deoxy-phosphogluconate aldolase [Candidatus Bathyarchaeia archaeon]
MDIVQFKTQPVLGILRGISAEDVCPITETSISAGLKTLEITMNTARACDLIKAMAKAADGRLSVGAGTVLSVDEVKAALDSGAEFIVAPVFDPEVVSFCVKKKIPVFPGALTPQEIYAAWQGGATMVKVFPSQFFGPAYFKEIKGPFQDIELLACGGVTAENIGEYFRCGASAVAFGGSIFRKDWMKEKRFDLIGEGIRRLVEKVEMTKDQ